MKSLSNKHWTRLEDLKSGHVIHHATLWCSPEFSGNSASTSKEICEFQVVRGDIPVYPRPWANVMTCDGGRRGGDKWDPPAAITLAFPSDGCWGRLTVGCFRCFFKSVLLLSACQQELDRLWEGEGSGGGRKRGLEGGTGWRAFTMNAGDHVLCQRAWTQSLIKQTVQKKKENKKQAAAHFNPNTQT